MSQSPDGHAPSAIPTQDKAPGGTVDPNYGRKAVFASAIGYGLDGFDLMVLSFALTGIVASFGISDTAAGSLATLTLFGAMIGGFVFGTLADRFGRVRMLTYSIILFAVFTGLCALATGFWDLAAYRFVAGIGIGGEFGIGMTLAAEAVAGKKRARATSWVAIGFQFGVVAAALVSAPVLSTWGWRGLFVIGAVPALVAVVIRAKLPESPKFLERKAAEAAGEKTVTRTRTSLRMLVANPVTTRTTIGILVLTSVQNFGYFGIMTWLPSYLGNEIGLQVTGTAMWTIVTVLGMMLGIVVFGTLADRIGRRKTFWIITAGAAIFVLVYSMLSAPAALLVGGFVMGIFANGMLGGLGALMAEHYPTEARATAENVLFNIGRGIGGLAPVVIAALATQIGFAAALGMLSIIYVLAFFAMFLIPEKAGTELD